MIRILNFVCVALAGFSCLALYHVSEQTRVARVELSRVNHQISQERGLNSVLEAEWDRVAEPGRIQHLAQTKLGLDDFNQRPACLPRNAAAPWRRCSAPEQLARAQCQRHRARKTEPELSHRRCSHRNVIA